MYPRCGALHKGKCAGVYLAPWVSEFSQGMQASYTLTMMVGPECTDCLRHAANERTVLSTVSTRTCCEKYKTLLVIVQTVPADGEAGKDGWLVGHGRKRVHLTTECAASQPAMAGDF